MSEAEFCFRDWVSKQSGEYTMDATDPDHIKLITDYAVAEINFYIFDTEEIVEFRITNKKDGEDKFFLHFQPEDEEHAKGLFREMTETLVSLRGKQATEILICCTAGFTSSFFADKLNEVSRTLNFNYHFSAVSVNDVYESAMDKAAVMLAPQIGYMEKKVREILKPIPVFAIPARIFGAYDAGACVQFVTEQLKNVETKKEQTAFEHIMKDVLNDKRILVIATMHTNREVRIAYRIYDHGKVTINQEVIKQTLNIQDIEDVIKTQICSCTGEKKVDAVGIAVPGILHDGKLDLPKTSMVDLQNGEENNFEIEAYFKEKGNVPVFIFNNANAAAMGWYEKQNKYKNIVFHSQPTGHPFGGQGIILNGKLHEGRSSMTGEVKFLINQFQISHPMSFNAFNPDDLLELVAKVLVGDIVYLDPEVICVRCELLPNMEDLKRELMKYLPENRIPDLVHITDFNEYMLLGEMFGCVKGLAKMKKSSYSEAYTAGME